jgi:hypothetical protein
MVNQTGGPLGYYISPFQGFVFWGGLNPGRCPGLVYLALTGLGLKVPSLSSQGFALG